MCTQTYDAIQYGTYFMLYVLHHLSIQLHKNTFFFFINATSKNTIKKNMTTKTGGSHVVLGLDFQQHFDALYHGHPAARAPWFLPLFFLFFFFSLERNRAPFTTFCRGVRGSLSTGRT